MGRWALLCLPVTLWAVGPEGLIKAALDHHPQLQSRHHAIQMQQSLAREAGRLPSPVVELLIDDPGSDEEMQMVMLAQSWPIGGRLGHSHQAALAQSEIAHQSLERTRRALTRKVREAAIDLAQAQARLALIERYLSLASDLARSAASGQGSRDHRMQLRSDSLRSELLLAQSRWQLQKTEAQLALKALTDRRVEQIDLDLAWVEAPPLAHYETQLARHPRLLSVRAQQQQAKYTLDAARSARIPDVTTQLGWTRRESMTDFWSVGVRFALPVMGREEARIAASQAAHRQAQADKSDVVRQLKEALAADYARFEERQARYGLIADRLLKEAQHSYDLYFARVQSAQAEFLVLFEALGALIDQEALQVDAAADLHRAKARLDEWIGE
jgi:cobalt-zinc-cadmium efflux system outer membrane protein